MAGRAAVRSQPGSPGWAVRLVDLVALGAEGAEVLTPLPYDLDPRAWGR